MCSSCNSISYFPLQDRPFYVNVSKSPIITTPLTSNTPLNPKVYGTYLSSVVSSPLLVSYSSQFQIFSKPISKKKIEKKSKNKIK